jgi:hypothetical protein
MPPRSAYSDRTSIWFLLAAAGYALAGLGLLYAAEWLDPYPKWKSVANGAGGLVIASVAIGLFWELRGKRVFVEEILDTAKVSRDIQAAKLLGITTQFQEGVDWTSLLDGAKELDMMVASARSWRGRLSSSLNKIAARPNARINVILPDPTNQTVVRELAGRFSGTEESVVEYIREAEAFFKDVATRGGMAKGALKIWYFGESPLFTFYRIDGTYVLVSYRHGGKGDVPTLVCSKGGSIAEFIEEQMKYLMDKKQNSRVIYSHKDSSINADSSRIDTASLPNENSTSLGDEQEVQVD